MKLTKSEMAELEELQRRAYGRHAGDALDEASLSRLVELEQTRRRPNIAAPEDAAAVAVDAQPESAQVDRPSDGELATAESDGDSAGTQRLPAWLVPSVAAAAGIAVGLLIPLGIDTMYSSEANGPATSSNPQLANPAAWDAGSIRYVGEYRTAYFWLATQNEGQSTCLVVEDSTDTVITSNKTCAPTDIARESGVRAGFVSGPDPESTDALITVRTVAVTFSSDGTTLVVAETLTSDPEAILRDIE